MIRLSIEHPLFWKKVDKNGPKARGRLGRCWLWTACVSKGSGYGLFGFDGRTQSAHRVSWQIAFGPIRFGLSVLHKCDVKTCVRPSHLFLGTKADNNRDMRRKGRHAQGEQHGRNTMPERTARGERNGSAKLTRAKVRRMRKQYEAGTARSVLAERYGITREHVWQITTGRYWPDA